MEGWEQVTIVLAGTHHLFIHAKLTLSSGHFSLFLFCSMGLALFLLCIIFLIFFIFYFLLLIVILSSPCLFHHHFLLACNPSSIIVACCFRRLEQCIPSIGTGEIAQKSQFIAIHQVLNKYDIKRFDASETSRD